MNLTWIIDHIPWNKKKEISLQWGVRDFVILWGVRDRSSIAMAALVNMVDPCHWYVEINIAPVFCCTSAVSNGQSFSNFFFKFCWILVTWLMYVLWKNDSNKPPYHLLTQEISTSVIRTPKIDVWPYTLVQVVKPCIIVIIFVAVILVWRIQLDRNHASFVAGFMLKKANFAERMF